MFRFISILMLSLIFIVGSNHHYVLADTTTATDPLQAVTTNTDKALSILKGPVAKFGGAVVLLAGVAGLLRGHYQLAISCAVAYAALMFLNNNN